MKWKNWEHTCEFSKIKVIHELQPDFSCNKVPVTHYSCIVLLLLSHIYVLELGKACIFLENTQCADLATERECQLTTAHANKTTGLTNTRAANWASAVEFSPFRLLSPWLSVAKSAKISLLLKEYSYSLTPLKRVDRQNTNKLVYSACSCVPDHMKFLRKCWFLHEERWNPVRER